jgi:copper chaperone NosL
MIGVGLGVFAFGYETFWRRRHGERRASRATPHAHAHKAAAVSLGILLLAAAGCSKEPRAIAFGTDTCAYCEMTISNERYGAVLVTSKGRSLKFDSIECMVESQLPGEKFAETDVHASWVVTYESRGALLEASRATYLVSEGMPSPMGANITAFANAEDAGHVEHMKPGEILDWDGIQAYVRDRRRT